MERTYKFAERIVCISSLYSTVHIKCDKYAVSDSQYDFRVQVTFDDLLFERLKCEQVNEHEEKSGYIFTDEYLETLAVYRQIAEQMPKYDTVLFHGSCVAVDRKGYLFTAKSGTGKSTHTRLWREMLGDQCVMVNDDKPLIRVSDGCAEVFGTPWDGKHHLSTNTVVPLKALCILERAESNTIERITARDAYPMLLQQVYRPVDPVALSKTVGLIEKLSDSVSFWRLGCNMNIEAAQIAYNAMKD